MSRGNMPAWDGSTYGTGWIAPTLLNSWVNFGGAWSTAAYRLDGNRVQLRGLIKSGTTAASTAFFTLPAGYRIGMDSHFVSVSNNAVCTVQVMANGNVQVGANVSATWLSLDSISFIAEQ